MGAGKDDGGGNQERRDAHVVEARDGPAASLQCMVESTWWPVSAASMAISAVSVSRISPIMTMSGSWRKMERKGVGEGEADVLLGRQLVDAGHLEFHRVLDGDDVPLRAVQFVERGVKRRGFAGAGRAGDENQSVRGVDGVLELLEGVGSRPSLSMLAVRLDLSSTRITIFSPCTVGRTETRRS